MRAQAGRPLGFVGAEDGRPDHLRRLLAERQGGEDRVGPRRRGRGEPSGSFTRRRRSHGRHGLRRRGAGEQEGGRQEQEAAHRRGDCGCALRCARAPCAKAESGRRPRAEGREPPLCGRAPSAERRAPSAERRAPRAESREPPLYGRAHRARRTAALNARSFPACCVDLVAGAGLEEEGAHVLGQERAGLRVHEVQAVVVDEHHLLLQPLAPALLADLADDAGADGAGKGGLLESRARFAAAGAGHGFGHVGSGG